MTPELLSAIFGQMAKDRLHFNTREEYDEMIRRLDILEDFSRKPTDDLMTSIREKIAVHDKIQFEVSSIDMVLRMRTFMSPDQLADLLTEARKQIREREPKTAEPKSEPDLGREVI